MGATVPAVGFTLVIVGIGDGLKGQFTGSNGTVEYYSVSTSFSPVNTLPEGFSFSAQGPETGNSIYGELSGLEVTDLTQTWGVSS
jgi:hypothetical protein